MIGAANGNRVSITGLGTSVPERVLKNDELAQMVDTSDEWIVARTGIHERRVAQPEEALSDFCLPAAREALEQAGVRAEDLDLVIIATVTPDMAFPATAALVADQLGATKAGAYDLSAGCTGFVYALAQAYAMLASGVGRRALVVGADLLSKVVDWSDRTTCVCSATEPEQSCSSAWIAAASWGSSWVPTAQAAWSSTSPRAARVSPRRARQLPPASTSRA